jgi:7-cyano-7-deazaguanine synthase
VVDNALVLFSGGQDSATALAWALDRFDAVETIGFDYGQRHRVELECRRQFLGRLRTSFEPWAEKLGEDHEISLSTLGAISDTSLTREKEFEYLKSGLPSSFVPGRNLIFFTYAAAVAYRRGIKHLVGGMCEADYSGYPDCRDDALKSLQVSLTLGMGTRFVIDTPLMWIDKAETWKMSEDLGGQTLVEMVIEDTHSCYRGDRQRRKAWGYGCGLCPACDLRGRGWEKYQARRNAPN